MFVAFGRAGLDDFTRLNGVNDGFAVVFIEARPDQGTMLRAHAVLNTRQGLGVALECAGDDGVKLQTLIPKAPDGDLSVALDVLKVELLLQSLLGSNRYK